MRKRNKPLPDQYAAFLVLLLILLTALGNALILFLFSLAGLVLGFVYYRHSLGRNAMLAATTGFVTAFVVALVMLLR